MEVMRVAGGGGGRPCGGCEDGICWDCVYGRMRCVLNIWGADVTYLGNIVVHRNLIPHLGVEGSIGLVIREPESWIFFYNGNFDLVSQKEKEFHLATTAQLIRLQNDIQRGSPKAEEMFVKFELKIKARNDVTEARKVVKDYLDDLGQHIEHLRRIQVNDIVKEVEDYLKTYSSAGMDISFLPHVMLLPLKPLKELYEQTHGNPIFVRSTEAVFLGIGDEDDALIENRDPVLDSFDEIKYEEPSTNYNIFHSNLETVFLDFEEAREDENEEEEEE
ncbi:hypothetical protein Tco_1359718 [Tanacetum coccineum]